jgi:antirestriction protein ArdC
MTKQQIQEQLDALRQEMANSAQRIRHGDRDVFYRPMAELLQQEQRLKAMLGQSRPTAIKPKYHKL